MVPKPEDFAAYVHKIAGIENHHHVVIYDNSERFGLFSAPRCWYLFRVMGHEFVHVVDGGLPKWVKDGFETASGDYSKAEELPGILKYRYIISSITWNKGLNNPDMNKVGGGHGSNEPRGPKIISTALEVCYSCSTVCAQI